MGFGSQLKVLAERIGLSAHAGPVADAPAAMPAAEPDPVPAPANFFDTSFYLATYADLRGALAGRPHGAAEAHWLEHGRFEVAEGRRPMAAEYDEQVYLASRPDVRAAIAQGGFLNGYDHWLLWGRGEVARGRGPSPFERHPAERPAILTDELVRFWDENGFVVLKGFFSPGRCDRVNRRIDALWERPADAPPIAIDINLDTGAERVRFADVATVSRAVPHKIYDLVLCDESVQDLALDETLVAVLRWVLDAEPVCIASLNFELGSTQGFHQDTLYMPGERVGGMAAAWIALEDVSPAAGPLAYYPGSHRIPLFHFSSGKPNQLDAEFGHYYAYMMAEVAARGIEPVTYLPAQGDVLLWHERLLHAGTAIEDRSLTRRSLVTHYWRAKELPSGGSTRAAGGAFWDRVWN